MVCVCVCYCIAADASAVSGALAEVVESDVEGTEYYALDSMSVVPVWPSDWCGRVLCWLGWF